MTPASKFEYPRVIEEICQFGWRDLTSEEMVSVAWAYYFFSIQFRESLKIARELYPHDEKLVQLEREECDTANLSPWPGVARRDEAMNHDEFMRRTIALGTLPPQRVGGLTALGQAYLSETRRLAPAARAASIASYEDGGLEAVFRAILTFEHWDNALLRAFNHFLAEHVRFDSDPDQGHGALSRHMTLDDSVLPLWRGFADLLLAAVPRLARAKVLA